MLLVAAALAGGSAAACAATPIGGVQTVFIACNSTDSCVTPGF